jgi:ABC-type lipoprotein release transport system permease subunit
MTFKAFSTILSKQIRAKWGRMFLASGGIMIGVWAITLTNGLSLGLNDTIVNAINSQPLAKEISINKTEGEFSFTEIPEFQSMSREEIEEFNNYEGVAHVAPRDYLDFYVKSAQNTDYACVEEGLELEALLQEANPPAQPATQSNNQNAPEDAQNTEPETNQQDNLLKTFNDNCRTVTTFSNVFQNFYETHKNNWVGSTQAPKRGEIVTCFECGSLNFGEFMGADSPEDLLGQTVYIELSQSPIISEAGEVRDVTELQQNTRELITESSTVPLEIVAVIDDRESAGLSLTGGANNNFFLDFSYYLDAIKLSGSEIPLNNVGFFEAVVILEDYSYLETMLEQINEDGYLATSIAQIIITGVDTIFAVQRAILFGFGLIILVASLFGIIAVMIISVLERKKEIGILKAMGSTDGDIFWLFLVESAYLGFLGWLLGTSLFYLCAVAIQQGFAWFLENNEDWKTNLQNFNINDFAPLAPWWLLLSTLSVSVLFTALSGLYPSIKAARQNPVDVLRNE